MRDIATGEAVDENNIRAIRPGFGLPPADWDRVLGRRASRPLKRGEPLAWDMLDS